MEFVIGIIVVLVILYFLFSKSSSTKLSKSTASKTKEERILESNMPWLKARWEMADKDREAGSTAIFSDWYFEDPTERQLAKLDDIGIVVKSGDMTKGQASDLIGLFEDPESFQEDVIKFFKVPMKGMNETKARHEASILLSDPEKKEAFENRAASTMEKEFYKFFNLKIPQGLKHKDADKFINEQLEKFDEEEPQKCDEWDAYENMYDELSDADYREDYNIKKVSLSLYREAIQALKKEGKSLTEVYDDIDMLIEKLIELKPDIER